MSDKVINELLGRIANLEYEVERLERNRDKAIEFINNFDIVAPNGVGKISSTGYGWRLLEILKGEENEQIRTRLSS